MYPSVMKTVSGFPQLSPAKVIQNINETLKSLSNYKKKTDFNFISFLSISLKKLYYFSFKGMHTGVFTSG